MCGDCLSALKTAIYGNRIYFYLAESADFEPLSLETKELLREIKSNTLNKAKSELAELTKKLEDLDKRVANGYIYVKTLEDVESNLNLATDKISTGDYKAFLDALSINRENYKLVEKAKIEINETIKARDKALAGISKADKMLKDAEESMTKTKEALRRCINASEILDPDDKDIETAKSKLELAKDKALRRDYKSFLDTIQISQEAYDLAYNAKSGLGSKREHYKNTRSERAGAATGAFFKTIGYTILIAMATSLAGCFVGCAIGAFSSASVGDGMGARGYVTSSFRISNRYRISDCECL